MEPKAFQGSCLLVKECADGWSDSHQSLEILGVDWQVAWLRVIFESLPIGSMYGIYANMWGILMVNVTIYTIHGSYGLYLFCKYGLWIRSKIFSSFWAMPLKWRIFPCGPQRNPCGPLSATKPLLHTKLSRPLFFDAWIGLVKTSQSVKNSSTKHTLWWTNIWQLKMAIEIVSFPINSMVDLSIAKCNSSPGRVTKPWFFFHGMMNSGII